jgi:hypothetical protein
MQKRPPMVIGLPPDQMVAYLESRIGGPIENLHVLERPVSGVKQLKRRLGWWAYEHPQNAGPWRRERARMQLARLERALARMRRGGA